MAFCISGLDPAPFAPLFQLSDAQLAQRLMIRSVVTAHPGTPCRVSLDDAAPGEEVLLLNHEHQPAATPYRASHAIFVRRHAKKRAVCVNEVPPALKRRLLSVRAFDAAHMLVTADVVEGTALAPAIEAFFAAQDVAYLQVHYARPGCYAARVERSSA